MGNSPICAGIKRIGRGVFPCIFSGMASKVERVKGFVDFCRFFSHTEK